MSEKRSKSNKKFMLLSAIGIFMVVDHHTFTAFNILGGFLPYNSFFMPMFVFISGYFNKVDGSTDLCKYLIKKIKTLLIPYVGLSLTVFGAQQLINYIKLGKDMDALPSGYLSFVLERVLTTGSYGGIVEPMWFVISLFAALMAYAAIKKLLDKLRLWNSFIMLILFCGLQLFVVHIAKSYDIESIRYFLVPLKCLFFFPFIELGILYRDRLEKKHTAMSGSGKIALLFILLIINAVRTVCLPNAYDIAFDSIDELAGFTSPYIFTPLISSVIGILFWLTVAELVGKQVYESRFINFMSCNTFWIMGLHILFFNILNCVLMAVSTNIVRLPAFDTEAFRETEWYFWGISDNIKILYVTVGVLGPLGLKWVWDRLAGVINERLERISAGSEQRAKAVKLLEKPLLALVFVGVIGLIVILTSPENDDTNEQYPSETAAEGGDEGAVPADEPYAYAYLDLAYETDGEGADLLTDACEVSGDGTYSITIKREDSEDTAVAMDNLSYMGIRLMDDESSALEISRAEMTDVTVICDGTELRVDISGALPFDDGATAVFFDCFDMENYGSGADLTGADTYDFTGKSEITVSFTLSGTDPAQ